jgi:hypothetical protein
MDPAAVISIASQVSGVEERDVVNEIPVYVVILDDD